MLFSSRKGQGESALTDLFGYAIVVVQLSFAFFLLSVNDAEVRERTLNEQVADTDIDITLRNLVMSPATEDETVIRLVRSSVETGALLVPLQEALERKLLLVAAEDETYVIELGSQDKTLKTDPVQHGRCGLFDAKGKETIRTEMLVPSGAGRPILIRLIRYRCT